MKNTWRSVSAFTMVERPVAYMKQDKELIKQYKANLKILLRENMHGGKNGIRDLVERLMERASEDLLGKVGKKKDD